METLPRIGVSRSEMMKRVARFKETLENATCERHVGATLMTRSGIGFALAW